MADENRPRADPIKLNKIVLLRRCLLEIQNRGIALNMGPATLGSVSGKYKLNATCNDCERSKELNVGKLKNRYGDAFEIPRLNKMVKCSECGSPNGCIVQLGNL